MKKNVLLAAIIVFVSFSFSDLSAQVKSVGKIFDRDVADAVFGKVFFSYLIDQETVKKIMSDTTSYVLFKVTPKQLGIFNNKRTAIYGTEPSIAADVPCYVFSKDKLKELLDRSKASSLTVEMRGSTVTLAADGIILDDSWLCPPVCP